MMYKRSVKREHCIVVSSRREDGSYPCHECARLLHSTPSSSPPLLAGSARELKVNAVGRHFAIRSDATQMRPMRVRSGTVARVTCGTTYPSSSALTPVCTGWTRQRFNDTWPEQGPRKGEKNCHLPCEGSQGIQPKQMRKDAFRDCSSNVFSIVKKLNFRNQEATLKVRGKF